MSNLQMMLALGAMIILTLTIIRINRTSLETEDVFYDSGFGILANSLATSIIEEASRKHFDSTTDTMWVNDLSLLTAPGASLKTEAGEDPKDITTFNDFDDFNGYTRVDSSMPSAPFKIECKVGYVQEANPDVEVNQKTWHKKISVMVTSEYMRDTIRQSSVFSYWSFR